MRKLDIKLFQCEECGATYNREWEAKHCCRACLCDICEKHLPRFQFRCDECAEKIAFLKAPYKMTYEEWVEQCPNLPLIKEEEAYWEKPEEDLGWCYGSYEEMVGIDPDMVMEDMCDKLFEGGEISEEGIKELEDFADQWNKKHGVPIYYKDKNVVVLLRDLSEEEKEDLEKTKEKWEEVEKDNDQ